MKLGIVLLVIGVLACIEAVYSFGIATMLRSNLAVAGAVIRLGIFGFMAYYGFKRIKRARQPKEEGGE